MDFGLVLPSYRVGATTESIDAGAETAARLGWHSAFTTDHILVEPSERSEDYFNVFDAVVTLAHVAAKEPSLKVGASVIVVPMRNAVVLAKELATIDALSGGRLIVGVGVGWNATEFGYVGASEKFHHRGAYLEEAVALWRQLWSGNEGPFHGRFHDFEEIRFAPLPVQGENVTVWFGGRDPNALRRAGRLGNGYHSSSTGPDQYGPRVEIVRSAAARAGRPAPTFSARVRVAFEADKAPFYMVRGTPEAMIAELRAFAEIGVDHVAVDFAEHDPERLRDLMERFGREVVAGL